MNRKTRREYERKYGKDFSMQKYREEAMATGSRIGAKAAIEVIMYMTAYTLNYKLGLGRKRLPEMMNYIIDNIDAYNTGHLSSGDFETIKKEMNKLGFIMKGD